MNNQYNEITNKLDLVTLEKDSAINKFNELELKYKEERNNWSEKQGEQLGDILGNIFLKNIFIKTGLWLGSDYR